MPYEDLQRQAADKLRSQAEGGEKTGLMSSPLLFDYTQIDCLSQYIFKKKTWYIRAIIPT
jgi:hypothetical protein